MAQLAINSDSLAIVNSGLNEYQFTSWQAVRGLAAAMQNGEDAVLNFFEQGNVFLDQPPVTKELYREIFGVTQEAIFQGKVFDMVQDPRDTLEDIIERVGTELAEPLAAFEKKTVEAGKAHPTDLEVTTKQPSGLVWKKASEELPDLSQQWTNFGTQTFTVQWDFYDPFASVITAPTTPLKPGFNTALAWYQGFSTAWTKTTDGYILLTGTDGISLGIKIHVPQEVFDIGTTPYYQVWQGTGTPDWEASEQRPEEGYTFQGLSCGPVTFNPTASHSSLLLDIGIPRL